MSIPPRDLARSVREQALARETLRRAAQQLRDIAKSVEPYLVDAAWPSDRGPAADQLREMASDLDLQARAVRVDFPRPLDRDRS